MKNKNHLICFLPLACLLFAVGCNNQSETSPVSVNTNSTHVISLITKLTNTVYWQAVFAGAKEAGKDYGYDITWGGSDRETNCTPQIELVNQAIAAKVSGVLLSPVDRTGLVDSVNKLADMNIPCVIIDSGLDAVRFLSIASTDNYEGGAMAARCLGNAMGGKGKVLVVRHISGSHAAAKRVSGFVATLAAEFPGITIVESESGQDRSEIARQVTEGMLQRHPDAQGLFACNVDVSVGALEALQEMGRTDVKMVAFDPAKSLIDGLKSGQVVAMIVQDPYKMGYDGVQVLALHCKGQSSPRVIDTGVEAVTMKNITDPAIMRLLGEQQ